MSLSIHPEYLNTPRLVADENQVTVWKWEQQEPFGAGACNPDPDGDNVQFEFNLRFPGQYFDKETNAHYNYFRDYDPGLGRYVQSDPIGLRGGSNTYGYVGADVLIHVDPFGLSEGPPYDPTVNMNEAYLREHNCYSYAFNRPGGSRGGFTGGSGKDPGGYSGKPFSRMTCTDIRAAAKRDGAVDPTGGTGTGCEGECPDGYYKVRLFVRKPSIRNWRGDYHWQRQDQGGGWSEKQGIGPVRQVGQGCPAVPFAYREDCGILCARR